MEPKMFRTVHLVNFTNPIMMKGPLSELLFVDARVSIKIPENKRVTGVTLLMGKSKAAFENKKGFISLRVPGIANHKIVAPDLA